MILQKYLESILIQSEAQQKIDQYMDKEKQNIRISVCNCILSSFQNETKFGNLYLGGIGSLKPQIIDLFKITAVLTIMDSYMFEKNQVKNKVDKLGIVNHKWIDIQDEQDTQIGKHFTQCYEFIQNHIKDNNVLVHCHAGVSRSATIVIYYIMKKLNLPLQLANKLVVSKRYQVSPNSGFWQQLKKQDYKLQVKSQKFVKDGIIDPKSEFASQKYPQKFANHIIQVNQDNSLQKGNLFLGQFSILKSHFLKQFKIKSILTVVDEAYYQRMKVKKIIEHEQIMNHLWLDLKDVSQEDISKHFNQTYNFIDQNLKIGNVLVHCQAGVSRSASIVIAFIIKKFKVHYTEACQFVKSKRHCVKPNPGFQIKLIEYSEK